MEIDKVCKCNRSLDSEGEDRIQREESTSPEWYKIACVRK